MNSLTSKLKVAARVKLTNAYKTKLHGIFLSASPPFPVVMPRCSASACPPCSYSGSASGTACPFTARAPTATDLSRATTPHAEKLVASTPPEIAKKLNLNLSTASHTSKACNEFTNVELDDLFRKLFASARRTSPLSTRRRTADRSFTTDRLKSMRHAGKPSTPRRARPTRRCATGSARMCRWFTRIT